MLFPKPSKVKRGNTKRNISNELKEYIVERDSICVICKHAYIQTVHHCFFGNQAMYGKDRNNPEFCVGLCNYCHHKLHFEGGNTYREDCIKYLQEYYGKI